MKSPKTLREAKEQQDGFEIKTAYFLELEHNLMGFFPAVLIEKDEFFVYLDKELLEKVWELLLKRHAKLTEVELYVNNEYGIGFALDNGDNTKAIPILAEEEFQKLTKKDKNPFGWAPGLLSFDDSEVKSPF